MRVLMVSSLWPPHALGGAELYASRLAAELRRHGHVVAALTLGVDGDDVAGTVEPWPYPLQAWAEQPSWKRMLFHGGDLYRPGTARALRHAIANFRPDVVHSHAVQGLSISALTTPAAEGVAHVHTLHDYWLLCQRTTLLTRTGGPCRRGSTCGAIAAMRRTALTRSGPALYIAPSHVVADRHAHLPGGSRMRVLHHPTESVPPPAVRAPSGELTFGFMGQLTEAKGVRTLLSAFAEPSPVTGARLVIAGTGPLAPLVADRASASAHVRALGWVSGAAKEAFFAEIDCLIVPSEWDEPAGLVVAEAAARGKAVVAAAAGGIPEYLAPASRPLLFSPGDVDDLRLALARFTADPVVYAGDTAHLCDWDEHVAAVVDAYTDATGGVAPATSVPVANRVEVGS